MSTLKIGLFGLGTVGTGVYEYLQQDSELPVEIKKVAVANPSKERTALLQHHLYQDEDALLDDNEINLVIELINDPDDSFRIVSKAIRAGKHVISANKKMVALYGKELFDLKRQCPNQHLGYEAAVCGSIPILGLIDSFYQQNRVSHIKTISNGTSNYILSKLFKSDDATFETMLEEAQRLGFAEEDPSSDIDGLDSVYKLSILIEKAFGVIVPPDEIPTLGIRHIDRSLIELAKQIDCTIKLIGFTSLQEGKLLAYVLPMLFCKDEKLAAIELEENAIEIDCLYSGQQLLTGAGAGKFPTATAVIADIKQILTSGQAPFLKGHIHEVKFDESHPLPALVRSTNFQDDNSEREIIQLKGMQELQLRREDILLTFSDEAYKRYELLHQVSEIK